MTTNRTVSDSEIEVLADEAEVGYDVDQLVARRNKRGRPTLEQDRPRSSLAGDLE